MALHNVNRVRRDLSAVVPSEENCAIHAEVIDKSDITKLRGMITGPPGTPFEGGKFELQIDIPEKYPFKPPKVKFTTKIWHPNISSATGALCLDIYCKNNWSPAMSLRTVLLSIQAMLQEGTIPDHSPLDTVVAKQYENFPEMYKQTASYWSQVYAGAPNNEKIDTSELNDKLTQLVTMGFEESQSLTALSAQSWDIERAKVYIKETVPDDPQDTVAARQYKDFPEV